MLFGKNYDKTLWLLLSSSKKRRKKMEKFLSSIPAEFYNLIKDKISKYEEYEKNKVKFSDRDEKHLMGVYTSENGLIYQVNIDSNNGMLTIVVKSITSSRNVKKVIFSMSLLPYNLCDKMECFDKKNIGEFFYQDGVVSGYDPCDPEICDFLTYNLMKTPLGMVLCCSSEESFIEKRFSMVSLKQIPSDVNLVAEKVVGGQKYPRIRK